MDDTNDVAPEKLSKADALKVIREMAADTAKIVSPSWSHSGKQAKKRRITRRQIELCVQKGTITEGPFINPYGNWQVNLYRHAAGEEITCVVAIEWATKLIVVTTF